MEFILKAIIGGLIVAGVVTAAQRGNPTLGALILGIPLVWCSFQCLLLH
jgi:hypothetical protein